MERIETGAHLHLLHLVHSVTVCHVDTAIFKPRSSVREGILDYKVFALL